MHGPRNVICPRKEVMQLHQSAPLNPCSHCFNPNHHNSDTIISSSSSSSASSSSSFSSFF
ncbi:hypothetical protein M440DRAFT_1404999 [Trichoderma longibrachiatum ATCC 18648]|uniref:Uncharacterized protein n=1 Tax=Trichoderma longibrachiatum ATCC 18648 TaxID=983965 RepID=A0A2T4BVK4_TRILO|nr:hypothetical protein M440DRAFT_1404999 [Trichoderma longibrachiatum ATCC 18648]